MFSRSVTQFFEGAVKCTYQKHFFGVTPEVGVTPKSLGLHPFWCYTRLWCYPNFSCNIKKVFLICTLDRTLKELGHASAEHKYLNTQRKSVILSNTNKKKKKNVGWNKIIIADLMVKYEKKNLSPPSDPTNGYLTVTDLIRFLRNVFQHLDEYRQFIEGSPSSGIALDHIIKPFPNLIVECWSFVQLYRSLLPQCCRLDTSPRDQDFRIYVFSRNTIV
jgi:hypothetical protein